MTKEKVTAHARMGVIASPTHGFMRGLRAFERCKAMLDLKQHTDTKSPELRKCGGDSGGGHLRRTFLSDFLFLHGEKKVESEEEKV